MPIYFYAGKILIRGGLIAMGANCCCNECCCPLDLNTTYTATFSSSCAAVDGITIPLKLYTPIGDPYCQQLAPPVGVSPTIENCTTATIPITIMLRCNKNLAIGAGQGSCGQYELVVWYQASTCDTNPVDFRQVASGCSCSPLSLVFTVRAPKWDGVHFPKNCDCCNGEDVTVTITA